MKFPKIKGYFRVFRRYISQKFVLTALCGAIGVCAVYCEAIRPVVIAKWYEWQEKPTFTLNSQYMENYTGEAVLCHNGEIVYDGMLDEGKISGFGSLYSQNKLVYKGEFVDGFYEGEGELYENDVLQYKGNFVQNVFSGHGVHFGQSQTKYDGEFADGVYDGNGVLYDQNGKKVYDGQWAQGVYDGQGKLYDNGILKYEGEFSEGLYQGDGSLYNTTTGFPVFIGKFAQGNYTENGTHYDEKGKPYNPDAANIDPLSLIALPYEKLLELLTQLKIQYKESEYENGKVVFLTDHELILDISVNDTTPLVVRNVYICGKQMVSSVMVGMDTKDMRAVLGEGEQWLGTLDFVGEMCLNYVNFQKTQTITSEQIAALIFRQSDIAFTVFYKSTESDEELITDGEAIFISLKLAPALSGK